MNSRSLALIGAACLAGAAIPAMASAAWTAPATTISVQATNPFAPVGTSSGVDLAMDADGNATAVWAQRGIGDAYDTAYAARMVDGNWSAPVAISSAGFAVVRPHVALGASGDPVVVWLRNDSASPGIPPLRSVQAIRYSGGRWVGETTLEPTGNNGNDAYVAVDAAGSAMATWTSTVGVNARVRSSRLSGGAWSGAEDIPGTTNDSSIATARAGAPGQVTAAWVAGGGGLMTSTAVNGVWGDRSTLTSGAWTPVSLAFNATGGGALVWYEVPAGSGIVRVARRAAGGWSIAEDVSPVADDDRLASAAVDASGTVTVAWVRTLPDNTQVVQAARSTATGWTAPVDLSPAEPVGTSVRLAIAASSAGQVTVVWNGAQAGAGVMRASTRTAAGWGEAAVIDGPRAGEGADTLTPYGLAADSLGRVTGAWLWSVVSGFNAVHASRLQGVPGAPTAASGAAGNASVEVKWTAPGDNGSSAITGYRVTAAPGGATCTSTTTTCRVAGLTNGTAYTFTVAAANAIGTGPESSATAAVRPEGTTPPRVVGKLKATIKVRNRVVTTTGSVATGVTKVTQKATAKKKKARTASCRILAAPRTGADRAYRCTMRIPAAKWSITTEARDRLGVVARSVRSVKVR